MKSISTEQFSGLTKWQIRDSVHAFYRNHLQGTSIINKDKGITIEFKKVGRKKTAKPLMSKQKAAIILNLPHLLKDAQYTNFGNPKQRHIDEYGAIGFLNFKISCLVDKMPRKFRVPVMITTAGKFQYDLHEHEKK